MELFVHYTFFQMHENFIRVLSVFNDSAEENVKFIQDFARATYCEKLQFHDFELD